MEKPQLTLQPEEASLLQEAYASASVILEYGAGGSTWIASQMPRKKIISVDSDRVFLLRLAKQITSAGPLSMPLLHYVNIGPVGKWGKPLDSEFWQRFPDYSMSPWDLPAIPQPDIVFINGHFRAACLAAVKLRTAKPVRVLINDYTGRPDHHVVERLCRPERIIGRMAEFQLEPCTLTRDQARDLLSMFFQTSFESHDRGKSGEEKVYDLVPVSPDLALRLPDAAMSTGEDPTASEEERLLAKVKKLKRQHLLLAIPYAVLALPLLLPALIVRAAVKARRRQAGPKIGSGLTNRLRLAAPRGRSAEHEEEMSQRHDDFVLYRIIGNDLEPRHNEGQSVRNVRFILDKEPELKGCRKRWLLNRIHDQAVEQQIIDLLDSRGQEYLRLPFCLEEYAKVPFDYSLFPKPDFLTSPEFSKLDESLRLRAVVQSYRLKNNYVMNNNGARNEALRAGQSEAKWVMPWDGNCFLTGDAWDELRETVLANRKLRYFIVPMARFTRNEALLTHATRPNAAEEPQILFRCDAHERFDAAHPYGRRPKVELLARLGARGPWENWRSDPWDLPIRQNAPEPGHVGTAGWVGRLSSGKPHLETTGSGISKARTAARSESIIATLNKLDDRARHLQTDWYREAIKSECAISG